LVYYIFLSYYITILYSRTTLPGSIEEYTYTRFPSNAWKLIEVCSHARQFDISICFKRRVEQVQAVHTITGCVWLICLTEFNHRVPWISRTKHGKKRFTSLLCSVYWKMYITSHLKWINKKSCARSEILFFSTKHTWRNTYNFNYIGTFIIWIFKL